MGVTDESSEKEITRAFRRLAVTKHVDKGGSYEEWHVLQGAYRALVPPPEILDE